MNKAPTEYQASAEQQADTRSTGLTNDPDLMKSWQELDRSTGGTGTLKARNPQLWAFKYKQEYGVYPTGLDIDSRSQNVLADLQKGLDAKKLQGKSLRDLEQSGEDAQVRRNNPELYRQKYFEYYGTYPKDSK